MRLEYEIPPCSGRAIEVRRGQKIAVTDTEGGQVVDFFAEMAGDPDEFLSTGVTIDCNDSLRLRVGDRIYSNRYTPMFRVLSDDVGVHDLLHPCCRPEMYDFFYGNGAGHPNCHDTINACLKSRRPIIHPVNLFMNTQVAGDTVVLLAEADVRLGVAACSVSESACNGGKCTGVLIAVED